MSLFHINRYTGDDEEVVDEKSRGSSAIKILDKIKKEADSRRKEKLTAKQVKSGDKRDGDVSKLTDDSKTVTRRKERKRKHSKSEQPNDGSSSIEDEITDCLQERLQEDEGLSQIETSPAKKSKFKKINLDVEKTKVNDKLQKIKQKKKRKLSQSLTDSSKLDDGGDASCVEKEEENSSSSKNDDESLEEKKSSLVVSYEDEGSEEDSEEMAVNEVGGFTVIGEVKSKVHKQVKRVLPDWLVDPSVITADLKNTTVPVSSITGLDQQLQEALKKNGITQFFPVQIQVLPMMLESLKMGFLVGRAGFRPSDICVSAPTGSGKTLAFVLPIVQTLKSRVTCQVRALVVLPVRDLAIQVFKVFKTYCDSTKLKVALLVGQKQFHQEQQTLVKKRSSGYESLADIVVATPGRLVDHINSTTGFSLQQLRFLVIDEADKMMDHIKQDWLTQVENAVYSGGRPVPGSLTVHRSRELQIPLQKLLFSATLSQNPDKLQQLNLFQPKLFTSVTKGDNNVLKPVDLVLSPEKQQQLEKSESKETEDSSTKEEKKGEFIGKYTTPAGLTEYFVECTAAQKPLIILHFLHNLNFRNILCFTNSVEATHRLYHLVKLIGGIEVREFSSGLHTAKRNRILQHFSKGKIDIVICSDAMARGMDVENVKYVISYDPPPFIKTYIHRVGRTARASKVGTAITMLQKKEFYHFKKMTRDAGKTSVKELKVTKSDLQPMVPAFQEALEQLQELLQAEKMKRKSKG